MVINGIIKATRNKNTIEVTLSHYMHYSGSENGSFQQQLL